MYTVWFFDVPHNKIHTGEGNVLSFRANCRHDVMLLLDLATVEGYTVVIEPIADGE